MSIKLDKTLILNAIKLHYNFKTDKQFADYLGITPQGLSSWYTRNTFDYELIYSKCIDIDANWLLTGSGEMLKRVKDKQNADNETKSIPLISVEAMTGYGNGNILVSEYEIQERYIIPEFANKGVKYLIRASGNSMSPKYNNGDILACRPINGTFFQWGKIYVLDTEQGPVIKRLFECKDNTELLECHSENKEKYPPFRIPKSEVKKIALVIGVICFE